MVDIEKVSHVFDGSFKKMFTPIINEDFVIVKPCN
jgi:hypothetical protein